MGRLSSFFMLVALTGCAGTVETSRLDYRYSSDIALNGVSYALPMLQYEVTVTHTLTGCGPTLDAKKVVKSDSLTFDTKVEPKARYIPGERYNVDYRKLSGLFRTSNFTIEYFPNGTIKSIGAGAEDKTGDALKSAAKLAGGVIALTAGAPSPIVDLVSPTGDLPPEESMKEAEAWGCSEKAEMALEDLEDAKAKLKTARENLESANNLVEGLSQRFSLKVSSEGDVKKWDEAIQDQLNKKRALETAKKTFDNSKAKLSVSAVINWPDFGPGTEDLIAASQPKSTEETFQRHFVESAGHSVPKAWKDFFVSKKYKYSELGDVAMIPACSVTGRQTPSLAECLAQHLNLTFDFAHDWPIEKPIDYDAKQKKNIPAFEAGTATHNGFFYREPAQGGVVICHSRNASNKCKSKSLAKPKMVNFPQAGQLRFIPFKVLAFQGKTQTLTFTEDGYPAKIELKSTKAAGAQALAAGADAVSTIATEIEKREEERRSDAKAQRDEVIAGLQFEIDLLEKRKKIAEETATPSAPSAESVHLAEINSDIELKRAELLQQLLVNGLDTGSIDPVVLFGPQS